MTALDRVSNLGDYLREQRQQAKLSLRQLSSIAGVSNPYLSQVERGLRKPSAEVLNQIAKALRISAEALYEQAGLLEPDSDRVSVRDAIAADPSLTGRQRIALLEMYDAFRATSQPDGSPVHSNVRDNTMRDNTMREKRSKP